MLPEIGANEQVKVFFRVFGSKSVTMRRGLAMKKCEFFCGLLEDKREMQ